jgi:hypothetical protein
MRVGDLTDKLKGLQIPENGSSTARGLPEVVPEVKEFDGRELDADIEDRNARRVGDSKAYRSRKSYRENAPSSGETLPWDLNAHYPGSPADSYSSRIDSGISLSPGDPWCTSDPLRLGLGDRVPGGHQADAHSTEEINEQLIREAIQLGKERRRAWIRGLERTHRWTGVLDDATSRGRITKRSGRRPFDPVRAAPRRAPSPPVTSQKARSQNSPDLSEPGESESRRYREDSWDRDEEWLLSLPGDSKTIPNSFYSKGSSA